jgi:cytochrome c-type biogenesis protein CcmH/NrfF
MSAAQPPARRPRAAQPPARQRCSARLSAAHAPARQRRAAILSIASLAIACLSAPALSPSAAQAASPRPLTSLPVIERQVMCVTCKIPLQVAESPQANREREFIQGLINEGDSEAQIKTALVGQYGPAVLGLPAEHGFDLAAYLVPLAVVLALIAVLLLLLPRWRRQARANAERRTAAATLSPDDAARLNADLARFD